MSEQQAEFDDALARVFAKVERAEKDAKNPHLGNKYPTLASVVDACREALVAEGFSWPQKVSTRRADGGLEVVITTQLRRKGVMLEADLPMPVGGKGTAQDVGSAITYGRRYGLAAMVGVCPDEDDDGHAASQPRERKESKKGRQRDAANDGPANDAKLDEAKAAANRAWESYLEVCKAHGVEHKPKRELISRAWGGTFDVKKATADDFTKLAAAFTEAAKEAEAA